MNSKIIAVTILADLIDWEFEVVHCRCQRLSAEQTEQIWRAVINQQIGMALLKKVVPNSLEKLSEGIRQLADKMREDRQIKKFEGKQFDNRPFYSKFIQRKKR